MSDLTVTEIFHSLQGESSQAGRPCVFVRLTGCPLRCRWCDTAYAFTGGTEMTFDEVIDKVRLYGTKLVELTGGEPLAQGGAVPLMKALLIEGYEVMLETSGAYSVADVPPEVRKIVDLKCPGSAESDRNLYENIELLHGHDEIKFVIADRADYEWSRDQIRTRKLGDVCGVLYSAVQGELEPSKLAEWILEDRLPGRLQIQLHKYLWPSKDRGY